MNKFYLHLPRIAFTHSLARNWMYSACCSVKKAHKPAWTSSAKQTTSAKSLLSSYIYCEFTLTFIRWCGSCYWGCGSWCLSSISAASEVMSTAENDAFIKIHRVFLGVNFLLEFFVKVERLPFKTTVHWGQVK